MRRPVQIMLVLMGGGLVAAAVIPMFRTPECDPAAEQAGTCSSGRSYSSSTSSHSGSGSHGGSTAGVVGGAVAGAAVGAAVSRGGFGAAGAHAGGGGG